MAKFNLGLPSYDDTLFSTQEERDFRKNSELIQEISIDDIVDFENHPFSVSLDDDMLKLIDSIQENGLLLPVFVRPRKDGPGYEMISGHRRRFAFEQLGLSKIKAIVKDLDDNAATVLMVDSNMARDRIKPTELGYAYKLRLEAMNHQGKHLTVDPTSGQVGPKYKKDRSDEALADAVGKSRKQVQRFIRLTYLIKPIQELVDEQDKKKLKIAFNPAVEISYLKENEQEWLYEVMNLKQKTPSLAQVKELKERSQKGILDKYFIQQLLNTKKPNEKTKIVLSDEVDKYFPKGYTEEQKTELITKLLKNWHKNREHGER